jgi:hypothetical protein
VSDERFIREVLERTSGSPCERARALLSQRADAPLAAGDGDLLRMHLEGCAGCRAMAVVMDALRVALPALAEMEPDEEFTAEVLARTADLVAARQAERAAAGAMAVPQREGRPVARVTARSRARGWWRRQVARPRFAWELAYAATLLLFLGARIAGAPLPDLISGTLQGRDANPVQLAKAAGVLGLASRPAQDISGGLSSLRREVENRAQTGTVFLHERWQATTTSLEKAREYIEEVWPGA